MDSVSTSMRTFSMSFSAPHSTTRARSLAAVTNCQPCPDASSLPVRQSITVSFFGRLIPLSRCPNSSQITSRSSSNVSHPATSTSLFCDS